MWQTGLIRRGGGGARRGRQSLWGIDGCGSHTVDRALESGYSGTFFCSSLIVMKSKRAEIPVWTAADLGVDEKMIGLAKRGDLHSRRQALAYLKDKTVTHRLFEEIKDRYLNRQGGYVRIVKKDNRKGDGAPVSIIQLLPEEGTKKKAKTKKKSPAKDAKPESKD